MTSRIFEFGQTLPGYDVPVLNERAVRASAGILFFVAMVTFMQALLLGNFKPTQVFVVAFLVEFGIRLFVNPRWAPVMIVGQWAVRGQMPEYVGAPQKRFAWSIGLALGLSMFYLIVVKGVIGPINMLVCGICLLLLFFEAAFGICLGCKLHDLLRPEKAQLCPGGACTYTPPAGAGGQKGHLLVLVVFALVMVGVGRWVSLAPDVRGMQHPGGHGAAQTESTPASPAPATGAEAERCKVPEFAKAMGHETIWKQHNGCQ
jgi:Domain of unknown function (DUF4395)